VNLAGVERHEAGARTVKKVGDIVRKLAFPVVSVGSLIDAADDARHTVKVRLSHLLLAPGFACGARISKGSNPGFEILKLNCQPFFED
jgi:hypothetical protein